MNCRPRAKTSPVKTVAMHTYNNPVALCIARICVVLKANIAKTRENSNPTPMRK